MPEYVVESSTNIDQAALKGLSRDERMQVYKDKLEALKSIIADFSAAHDNKVSILEGIWINTTVLIETDPDTATELAKTPGISKVDPTRTINPELSELMDERKRRPPGHSP